MRELENYNRKIININVVYRMYWSRTGDPSAYLWKAKITSQASPTERSYIILSTMRICEAVPYW